MTGAIVGYRPRSAIIRLVLAIARAGLSPFEQALAQFMIVWQRSGDVINKDQKKSDTTEEIKPKIAAGYSDRAVSVRPDDERTTLRFV